MRALLLIYILLTATITAFAQSDKDMIVASWKCVGIDHAVPATTKKQKPAAPKVDIPNVDSLRKQQVGVVYGFRNNGTLITNSDGVYEIRIYKVDGNTLTLTLAKFTPKHTEENTIYTILKLNYRTMTWQDANGIMYSFERE